MSYYRNTVMSCFAAIGLLLAVNSCAGKGPKVDVCLSDPAIDGFICVKPDGKQYELRYVDSNNYVAFSPADAKVLLDYCKGKNEPK